MVYGARYEAYHGLWSYIRGLPWLMAKYMRLTFVYGAVNEAYHGLWCCIRGLSLFMEL